MMTNALIPVYLRTNNFFTIPTHQLYKEAIVYEEKNTKGTTTKKTTKNGVFETCSNRTCNYRKQIEESSTTEE